MNQEKRDDYMERIEGEYRQYEIDMSLKPAADVFAQAASILNMRHAYDYLRSGDISDDELAYVMQAQYPLREVAGTHEAFESVNCAENPIATTVFDIYSKNLFDDADTEKYDSHIPICFLRKPSGLWDIVEHSRNRPDDVFKIEKVIELSRADFDEFSTRLLVDTPFIQGNAHLMSVDEQGRWHCLLVHDESRNRGILVESDGYPYARYAAYVADTRQHDLTNIPCEEHKRSAPERPRKPKQPER
ncbi:MAG TPA: DUF6329 domain-containing protein [Clostridia bacterium]|nr:DUF6329 domain-containing protein [Clostridia bacterium]